MGNRCHIAKKLHFHKILGMIDELKEAFAATITRSSDWIEEDMISRLLEKVRNSLHIINHNKYRIVIGQHYSSNGLIPSKRGYDRDKIRINR